MIFNEPHLASPIMRCPHCGLALQTLFRILPRHSDAHDDPCRGGHGLGMAIPQVASIEVKP